MPACSGVAHSESVPRMFSKKHLRNELFGSSADVLMHNQVNYQSYILYIVLKCLMYDVTDRSHGRLSDGPNKINTCVSSHDWSKTSTTLS